MKVLHVITGLGTGGAETQLHSYLRHTRHRADVVTLHNAGAVADALRQDGVRVEDLGMRGNRHLAALPRLRRLVRDGGYDVVHTHLYRACVYGRPAARWARGTGHSPRIVATEHSLQDGQLEGRTATAPVRWLYRASEAVGDLTIAVSRSGRDELLSWGVPERRVVVVPNGLDLPALAFDPATRARVRGQFGWGADVRVIGTVGRLHPSKQVDLLLRAAAPLLSPRCHLLVVGDGPERPALDRLARALGVSAHVTFTGERPAAPLLSAMDCSASPSRYETFGLAVLEALANGLPVAYRRSPALEELDAPPATATRIDGTEEAWRAGLVRLLRTGSVADRSCPPQLGALDIRETAARIDDLYDSIAGRRSPRSVGAPA